VCAQRVPKIGSCPIIEAVEYVASDSILKAEGIVRIGRISGQHLTKWPVSFQLNPWNSYHADHDEQGACKRKVCRDYELRIVEVVCEGMRL
jgi:hypothetical protein